jgi:uncharacterized Zn finger protein (UPF0148 family)
LPFCLNCGTPLPEGAKFCGKCGTPVSSVPGQQPEQPQSPDQEPVVHSQTIAETSRLSGVGIEKFLGPGERIVYATPGRIYYANQQRRVYVTNKRILFYGQQGVMLGLVKQDRLDEIFLNQVRKLKLVETGFITKRVHLELDEMKLEGQRGHLLDLYKAIQSARASV